MTALGTWVPAGPSRKSSGRPFQIRARGGKSWRARRQSVSVNGIGLLVSRLFYLHRAARSLRRYCRLALRFPAGRYSLICEYFGCRATISQEVGVISYVVSKSSWVPARHSL